MSPQSLLLGKNLLEIFILRSSTYEACAWYVQPFCVVDMERYGDNIETIWRRLGEGELTWRHVGIERPSKNSVVCLGTRSCNLVRIISSYSTPLDKTDGVAFMQQRVGMAGGTLMFNSFFLCVFAAMKTNWDKSMFYAILGKGNN